MRVHKLIAKHDKVLYWTRTSVFQYLVKPSTVKHQIFDTRFFIFDVCNLKNAGNNSFGQLCKRTLFNFWSLGTLISKAFSMVTKARAWWALKKGSVILSFSVGIIKMMWWPSADNLFRSWWQVCSCACFWGWKGSMHHLTVLIA